MPRKTITDLDAEREKRGRPVEHWRRQGIYAVLVPKPKAGKVQPLRRKKRVDT